MSQNDFTIANQGFPAFRADLNTALQALASNNSGTSAPSTTFANMWWYDSTNNIMYIRNEDNDAWIKFAELDQTSDKFILSGTLQLDDGSASAPALTFNSDTNMGIYRGGTDILKFVTAGTDAVTINASQNVGIGGDLTIPDKIIHDGDTNTAIRFPSADTVSFETGGSERARVTDDALMVGTTTNGTSADGTVIRATGEVLMTRTDAQPLLVNRAGNTGAIIEFRNANSAVGYISSQDADLTIFSSTGNHKGLRFGNAQIIPVNNAGAISDNTTDLGGLGARFDDVFATNGTIQTSDRNEKQDIEELSEAEQRVAVVAKGLMRKFRWKDKVAEKGDNARTHFGIIAQDLQDAFTAESLDASDYAMFCSDTWWEKEISVDAVVSDEENGIEAKDAYTHIDIKDEATTGYTEKTRLGVRYSELLAFIISAI